jgi:hypothetical protein
METDTAYAGKTKAMHIEITLSSVPQVVEEQALLDSGASENLINKETWETLRTKAFILPKPVTIYNLDGMENAQGRISQYCWLKVRQGDKEYTMRFFIAKMEKDHLILGHPFFSIVNPEINWQKKRVTGPVIDISTVGFGTAQGLLRKQKNSITGITSLWNVTQVRRDHLLQKGYCNPGRTIPMAEETGQGGHTKTSKRTLEGLLSEEAISKEKREQKGPLTVQQPQGD